MDIRDLMRPPDIMQARRVLAVQPHYDDNDIGAGGLLALLAACGAEIDYLTITDDLIGVVDETLSDGEATARLRQEQHEAGAIIGVRGQHWLGFPDAGSYDYFAMRRELIRYIRMLKPEVLITCDPWLPYEAHNDHILCGRAVAEASYLHSMKRLKTDPAVDAAYEPYAIRAVVFYHTHAPNTRIDITATREKKHRAIDCYRTQFTSEGMAGLHAALDLMERAAAEGQPFSHAEAFKVLGDGMLHCNPFTLTA